MSASGSSSPEWDLEQLAAIMEPRGSWQLVSAGPGSGKTAVACQRIAYLIDDGVPPARILLISFTRTAVTELRDRIVSYAAAGERARSVRISTIDSHAWSLRSGCDDMPLPKVLSDDSYDLSIARTVELFRAGQPDLLDFMARFEHVIIDETQDVIGARAELILEILRSLAECCGVTLLADSAQAIYGFTNDREDGASEEASLLSRLQQESPKPLDSRALSRIYRIQNPELIDLFLRTRKEIEAAQNASTHVAQVQKTIRETCGHDAGVRTYSSFPDFLQGLQDDSVLVLFRRRADVLFASSYCSSAGVEHRLRLSHTPLIVQPWLGWLFGEIGHSIIGLEQFNNLWHERSSLVPEPFTELRRDDIWDLLHRLAAGRRPGTIDIVQLRQLVARSRPPAELCCSDLGERGPILGTIHASKGREADTVVLFMPPPDTRGADGASDSETAAIFEEGRVYYVGATRARKMLYAAGNSSTRVSYLDGSKRIYRALERKRAQLEIGHAHDVDPIAHLGWNCAVEVQRQLASFVGRSTPVQCRIHEEHSYVPRLFLEQKGPDGVTRYLEIGELSSSFRTDLGKLWSIVDNERELKPPSIVPHLYLVGVTTVGLTEKQRSAVRPPFNSSGFALTPVVKGFPTIEFQYRRYKGR